MLSWKILVQRSFRFLVDNKEWIFSGIGVAALALLFREIRNSLLKISNFKIGKNVKKRIENGDIRIIGSRACGKTTFLAALADWHYLETEKFIKLVEPVSEDSRRLAEESRYLLRQGSQLEPTDMNFYEEMPVYVFLVRVLQKRYLYSISLTLRDYPGEFFENLASRNIKSRMDAYLDKVALSSKLILMLEADLSHGEQDSRYALAIRTLRQELFLRFNKGNRKIADYRIAIVFSKFDQLILKINQQSPKKFARDQFLRTYNELRRWSEEWNCSIEYFFSSAFGLCGTPPEPNTIPISNSNNVCYVLKNPMYWKPFGLISPILWLCTLQKIRSL